MSDVNKQLPFESLGEQLKRLREIKSESLAEVSGAVEIDETDLTRIETGHERPSEDILLLLISHFGIQDDQAAELWQLAGYDTRREDDTRDQGNRTQTMMVMIDPRIMYSDKFEVVANKQGVVLNFAQQSGMGSQQLTVSRIGMSREQAKALMGILHQALYDLDNPSKPKHLGSGTDQ